jgi:hypothetical protein
MKKGALALVSRLLDANLDAPSWAGNDSTCLDLGARQDRSQLHGSMGVQRATIGDNGRTACFHLLLSA